MNKFPLQSKVVEKKNLRARYTYHAHTVIAYTPNGDVITEMYGQCEKYSPDELWTEGEAIVEQAKLDAEKSRLDEEFENLRDKIQSRLNRAAELVKEAQDMAESVNKDFTSLRTECRPLFRALNDAGWSASSMTC